MRIFFVFNKELIWFPHCPHSLSVSPLSPSLSFSPFPLRVLPSVTLGRSPPECQSLDPRHHCPPRLGRKYPCFVIYLPQVFPYKLTKWTPPPMLGDGASVNFPWVAAWWSWSPSCSQALKRVSGSREGSHMHYRGDFSGKSQAWQTMVSRQVALSQGHFALCKEGTHGTGEWFPGPTQERFDSGEL